VLPARYRKNHEARGSAIEERAFVEEATTAAAGQAGVTSVEPLAPKRTPRLATRPTEERHRAQVHDITRRVHEASLFADIPFSEAKFDAAFDKTLQKQQQHLGLVVSLEDRVLGCAYCSIGEYFIGDGGRIVSVQTICVDPEVSDGLLGGKVALRLAKGIETWAQACAATHLLYHVTAGIEPARADRLFRKIGMKVMGGNYGMRLI